jgi:hypothetical protein
MENLLLPLPESDPLQAAVPVQFHPEGVVEKIIVEIL